MTARPTVLFVCVHNAGRSQMAAGWLSRLAGDTVEVRSAGSEPAEQINPVTVVRQVREEIRQRASRPFSPSCYPAPHSGLIADAPCLTGPDGR